MSELWRDGRTRAATLVLVALLLGAAAGQLLILQQHAPTGDWAWWLISTRNVVWIMISVVCISLLLGTIAGALVAYGPRLFSALLGRLVELSGALPSLIIVGLWRIRDPEPTIAGFIAILAALKTIEIARLISSETDRISSQGFVVAAKALGASKGRIFAVHVLPQLLSALAVTSALTAAAVVGLEAALSFVGLGLPGSSSWGALLGEAALSQSVLDQEYAAWPGESGDSVSTTRVVLALLSVSITTLALYALSRTIARRV